MFLFLYIFDRIVARLNSLSMLISLERCHLSRKSSNLPQVLVCLQAGF